MTNFLQTAVVVANNFLELTYNAFTGTAEITRFDLWGNYSIPKDNPYIEDSDLQPEIWALGLRNPWRCSFDSERPSYFMCADVGQVLNHSLLTFFNIGSAYLLLL